MTNMATNCEGASSKHSESEESTEEQLPSYSNFMELAAFVQKLADAVVQYFKDDKLLLVCSIVMAFRNPVKNR